MNSDESNTNISVSENELNQEGSIDLGAYKKKSVRIKNNQNYLFPIDPMKFFLPGQNINFVSINKTRDNGKDGLAQVSNQFWPKFKNFGLILA